MHPPWRYDYASPQGYRYGRHAGGGDYYNDYHLGGRRHLQSARAGVNTGEYFAHRSDPNTLTTWDAWAEVESSMWNIAKSLEVTDKDRALHSSCLLALRQVAVSLGDGWQVRAFGSTCNGFGKHGSDWDATCFREFQPGEPKPSLPDLLEEMADLLAHNPDFVVKERVPNARIPILRLYFKQALDVDISFQNTEPLPNTQLLKGYADLDQLVRALGVLVKVWAKGASVCGAMNGHLSAYALTLMVIYFLQVDPQLCLPVLPTELFDGGIGIPEHHCSWRSPVRRVADLLHRFFHFYAKEFRWGSEVVSVRCGSRLSATESTFSALKGRTVERLHIEDPFLLHRNLHCTLRLEVEGELRASFAEAWEALENCKLPAGLEPPKQAWDWDWEAAALHRESPKEEISSEVPVAGSVKYDSYSHSHSNSEHPHSEWEWDQTPDSRVRMGSARMDMDGHEFRRPLPPHLQMQLLQPESHQHTLGAAHRYLQPTARRQDWYNQEQLETYEPLRHPAPVRPHGQWAAPAPAKQESKDWPRQPQWQEQQLQQPRPQQHPYLSPPQQKHEPQQQLDIQRRQQQQQHEKQKQQTEMQLRQLQQLQQSLHVQPPPQQVPRRTSAELQVESSGSDTESTRCTHASETPKEKDEDPRASGPLAVEVPKTTLLRFSV